MIGTTVADVIGPRGAGRPGAATGQGGREGRGGQGRTGQGPGGQCRRRFRPPPGRAREGGAREGRPHKGRTRQGRPQDPAFPDPDRGCRARRHRQGRDQGAPPSRRTPSRDRPSGSGAVAKPAQRCQAAAAMSKPAAATVKPAAAVAKPPPPRSRRSRRRAAPRRGAGDERARPRGGHPGVPRRQHGAVPQAAPAPKAAPARPEAPRCRLPRARRARPVRSRPVVQAVPVAAPVLVPTETAEGWQHRRPADVPPGAGGRGRWRRRRAVPQGGAARLHLPALGRRRRHGDRVEARLRLPVLTGKRWCRTHYATVFEPPKRPMRAADPDPGPIGARIRIIPAAQPSRPAPRPVARCPWTRRPWRSTTAIRSSSRAAKASGLDGWRASATGAARAAPPPSP